MRTFRAAHRAPKHDDVELLQAAPAGQGNGQGTGHCGAQLGDLRAFGLSLRMAL